MLTQHEASKIKNSGPIVNGEIINSKQCVALKRPYDNQVFVNLSMANDELIEKTIDLADKSFKYTKALSAYQRSQILIKVAQLIERDKQQLADGITQESGKPISAAIAEVERSIFTFNTAAEETKRIQGEIISLDWLPGNEYRQANVTRVPRGLIVGITPFNFPLNLVAHKIAPAMAAANPIIIKPATQTAMTAIKLAQLIIEAGWPQEAIAIIPCENEQAKALVTDERIKLLTFTGSPAVGWQLKTQAGKKAVTLELGGNAATIIEPDANIDYAIDRIVWGGYLNSGQTCISVQRVYIEQSIYSYVKKRLIARVQQLSYGDPMLPDTVVGPVINQVAAERIMCSIEAGLHQGAKLLVGGKRHGLIIEPTLLECQNDSLSLVRTEIFGPVVSISPYEYFEEAVNRVNDSQFGLQTGIFCNNQQKIQFAINNLEVGGINVNDVSTFRIDHMPYGGVKSSGFGREGVRYAIEEMTEMKLITYNHSI